MKDTLALLLLASPLVRGSENHDAVGFTFRESGVSLPKAVSDLTATMDPSSGLAYLAGGCDAVLGNVFSDGFFSCGSISSSLLSFDRETKSFETLADLPVSRYRHAAVVVDRKLWLVGGRDVEDSLIATVDIYDIEAGTWMTMELPEEYRSSDLTAFANAEMAYVVGGYNPAYEALGMVFTINTTATMDSGALVIESKAPMLEGRGDLSSAVGEDGFALVAGGFSHVNGFCEPLKTSERYSFADDKWVAAGDLSAARGDKALVSLDEHIFAIGGERQIEGYCDLTEDAPEPGELTIAVDDVEVFHADDNLWETLEELPSHRFRFAAVGYSGVDEVYTFGGQISYNSSCQCFRTTNEVLVNVEQTLGDDGTDPDPEDSSTWKYGVTTLLGMALLASCLV